MKEWQRDKKWSDRFLPEIKRILGEHLIQEPPIAEDAERNTDLIVLRLDAIRIACRVRDNRYLDRYGDEFTIRSSRTSGAKTELTKVIEGWGDYLFYGFANKDNTKLAQWRIISLNVFRLWFMRQISLRGGDMPGLTKQNTDGQSALTAFDVRDMPSDAVFACGLKNG